MDCDKNRQVGAYRNHTLFASPNVLHNNKLRVGVLKVFYGHPYCANKDTLASSHRYQNPNVELRVNSSHQPNAPGLTMTGMNILILCNDEDNAILPSPSDN